MLLMWIHLDLSRKRRSGLPPDRPRKSAVRSRDLVTGMSVQKASYDVAVARHLVHTWEAAMSDLVSGGVSVALSEFVRWWEGLMGDDLTGESCRTYSMIA